VVASGVADHRFFSRYKLRKTDEFSSVFSFRRRINGKYLTVFYMPNALEYARLGVVVSKKIVRRAVARNYIKRVIRELFRLNYQAITPKDMVIRVNLQFGRHEFAVIEQEFAQSISKLPAMASQKTLIE
jgi:ribonuclease P protein component